MQIFKKVSSIAVIAATVSAAPLAVGAPPAKAVQDGEGPYYFALSKHSKSLAYSVFLKEQYLAVKCGKAPSPEYLKSIEGQNGLDIMTALNAGDYQRAKSLLAAVPCE